MQVELKLLRVLETGFRLYIEGVSSDDEGTREAGFALMKEAILSLDRMRKQTVREDPCG